MKNMKNSKQIERHIKGIANHRRIDILLLISKSHGITLDDIAKDNLIKLKSRLERGKVKGDGDNR